MGAALKQMGEDSSYMKDNYEVTIFCSDKYSSHIRNILARVINTTVQALTNTKMLPKIMIFMMEDDIIKFLDHNDYGATELFGKIISYLDAEIRKIILTFKDNLPNKCKRNGQPHMIWISPSMHKNYNNNALRRKFGGELEQILKGRNATTVLRLKQLWNTDDPNLVFEHSSRLSPTGENRIWRAVDRTIWYADTILFGRTTTNQLPQRRPNMTARR